MRVYVASKNRDKIKEIKEILGEEIEVLTCVMPAVRETGLSLRENAILKAESLHRITGGITVADDTGLFVDALSGAPGLLSSRFAGNSATYEDNRRKVLRMLKGVPLERRRARFICVAALKFPGKDALIFEGVLEGYISFEERGEGGFGYDPIFIVPEYGKTLAELIEIKNKISHRFLAFNKLKCYLVGA